MFTLSKSIQESGALAYDRTVTDVFRQDRYSISGYNLLNRMRQEFSCRGGAARLAAILGVSRSTAGRVLAGTAAANMNRLAYYYGFMPDETPEGWRVLPMAEEPFDEGPPLRWDSRLLTYVELVLSNPSCRPSVRTLAWRMDSTERRLRDAMRRSGIKLAGAGTARKIVDEINESYWD